MTSLQSSSLVKNTIIQHGVIDGFRAPDKIFSYWGNPEELEWLNEVGADCYFNNVLVVKPSELSEKLKELDQVLALHSTDYPEEDALALFIWESESAAMIAIISAMDGTSHLFKDGVLKYLVLNDMNDNSPASALYEIEQLEADSETVQWLIDTIKSFVQDGYDFTEE